MTVTLGQLVRFVELFAARLAAEKEYLTTLDSAIGDADHGINMDRGFKAVTAKLPELASGTLGGLLSVLVRGTAGRAAVRLLISAQRRGPTNRFVVIVETNHS